MGSSLVIKDVNQNEIQLQVDEIKKFIAPNATEQEMWLFINIAKAFNLNPIKREIYFVKYNNQAQIVTGYQVYLERAARSGLLEYWNVDVEKPNPDDRSTWIGVFTGKRTDWTKEFTWRVPMKEVDKKQSTWNIQPEFQLKKTTASQGIRILIPEILSGMPYTAEEVTSGTSEQIIEMEIIEPTEEERQAKEQARDEYLAKLNGELLLISEITPLEKHYKANKKKYDASELKDEILSFYEARKYDISILKLAELTELDIPEISQYMNKELMKDEMIIEALAGNEDAIKQVKSDVLAYLAMNDSPEDSESSAENEETQPDDQDMFDNAMNK